jgi:hypothetical protein
MTFRDVFTKRSHHGPYTVPSVVDSGDLYEFYRSPPASVDVDLLVLLSGRGMSPVSLTLQWDVLHLLRDALTPPPTKESALRPTSFMAEVLSTSSDGNIESPEKGDLEAPSILSLLHSLSINARVEHLQVYTWPSAKNQNGFVFLQESFSLLQRVIPSDESETKELYTEFHGISVDYLVAQMTAVDVYVRDWEGLRTSRRRMIVHELDFKRAMDELTTPIHRLLHAPKVSITGYLLSILSRRIIYVGIDQCAFNGAIRPFELLCPYSFSSTL